MNNAELQFSDIKNKLFNLWLSAYKKKIITYLKEGDDSNFFDREISDFYNMQYNTVIKSNPKYPELKRIFIEIQDRKAIDKFNKAIRSGRFHDEINNKGISEDEFINLHAEITNIEDIKYVHIMNRDIVKSIFSIYYKSETRYRIDLKKLPIFNGRDNNNIQETENKLNKILHPQQKKQELYPLSLFDIQLTVREVATLIIFMCGHYNIKPQKKSHLLEIAYLIFGDINLELLMNTPTNNSSLYDFIVYGKGLFVKDKYKYATAKSKIIKAISYEENKKFILFKSYIENHDLNDFKRLIKEK